MDSLIRWRMHWRLVLILVLCLSGAGIGSYQLYRDLTAEGGRGSGDPIADVQLCHSRVRRKSASNFLWMNVREGESLFHRDSIQTGPSAGAKIRLRNGTELEMGEDSLLVMDDMNELSLSFLQGSFVMRNEKSDRQINVVKNGKANVVDLAYRLLAPESQTHFFVVKNAPIQVTFTWKGIGATANSVKPEAVQVSTTPQFTPGRTHDFKLDGTREEYLAALRPGHYYWRLIANRRPLTESRPFRVENAEPLKPLSPSPAQKITQLGDGGLVQFRWAPAEHYHQEHRDEIDNAISHRIEVASDPEFNKIQIDEPIAAEGGAEGGVATLSGIPGGTFYWRIKSKYGKVSVTSQVHSCEVDRIRKLTFDLVAPMDKAAFNKDKPLRFIWKSPGFDVEYQWELARMEKDKEAAVTRQTSASPAIVWNGLEIGTYRWRVLALQKGQLVGESLWRHFSIFDGTPISLATPTKNQAIYFWDKPPSFNFSWQRDSIAGRKSSYQIEVARDSDFKMSAQSHETDRNEVVSQKFDLSSGVYYWRVRLVDDSGQVVKSSDVGQFAYAVHPLLDPPAEVSPAKDSVLKVSRPEDRPVLSWAAVPDAKAYEIVVETSEKPVLRTQTKDRSVELKGVGPGKYLWTIRAIDPLNRPGRPMAYKSFTIDYGAKLMAPQSLTPEVQ